MTGKRSPEARNRRRPNVTRAIQHGGTRIVCDECKQLHPPPVCPPGSEPITLSVRLPRWLHAALGERVLEGERSPWVVRLIRKELGL